MENHHYISNIVDIHDIQDINNAAQLYDSQQFYEIQKEHFLGEGEDTSTSLLALEYFTLSSKNAITESELKKIALDVILEDNILTKHYEPKVETKVEEAKSWPTRIKDAASDIFSILSELISGDSGEDGDSNDTGDSAGSSSSGGCNSDVQETCGDDVTTKIEFPDNDSQVKHIFRDKKGHVADTVENREIILNTVNDGRNYMATDKFGVQLYSKILKDGRQVWAEVWNGKISNAGINSEPIDILKRSAGKFK